MLKNQNICVFYKKNLTTLISFSYFNFRDFILVADELTETIRDFQDLSCTERKLQSVQSDGKTRQRIVHSPVKILCIFTAFKKYLNLRHKYCNLC
jgi:hypothetical protein